jgi:transposase-like protein
MIGNDPVINKFCNEYATFPKIRSLQEWAELYGVERHQIAKWVELFNEDIEIINNEKIKNATKNFQRLEDKVYAVLEKQLDADDKQTAISCLPFFKPKKEELELSGEVAVNQPIAISIKKMKQDSVDVSTGEP